MSPPRAARPDSRRFVEDERAQTVLDYGIAVGIFFVALVFVLGTIPGMFAPFVGSSGDTQVADRLATSLSADLLAHPSEPFILNETCTEAFFDQVDGGSDAPLGCQFDTRKNDLQGVFALDSTTDVRVELTPINGTAGINRTAGEPLPTRTTVSTARRTVGIEGNTHTLEVHVW